MSVVIVRTNAGAMKEQDAILQGNPLPRIAKMVFISAPAITDALDVKGISAIPALDISHEILASDLLFSRFPASATTQIHAHIAPEVECEIKAIALVLADGTVWGYAPYRAENGGLSKTNEFGITILCVVTRDNAGSISVSYDPFDTASLIETIKENSYAYLYENLRTAFYGTLCEIVAAPIHEDGDCLEIPLNESQIINSERVIVAEPILE